MIKCPHCGSTAQVKTIATKWVHGQYWYGDRYKCECGCGHSFVYQKVYYEIRECWKEEYLKHYEDFVYTGEKWM